MMNSGSLQKMFLAAAVLVVLVQCGHGQGKPTECCTKVSNMEIKEEVVGCRVHNGKAPCLPAVIFYTKDNFYCASIHAPWVRNKIDTINKAAAAAAARASTTGSAPSSSSTSSQLSSSFSPRLRPARH